MLRTLPVGRIQIWQLSSAQLLTILHQFFKVAILMSNFYFDYLRQLPRTVSFWKTNYCLMSFQCVILIRL